MFIVYLLDAQYKLIKYFFFHLIYFNDFFMNYDVELFYQFQLNLSINLNVPFLIKKKTWFIKTDIVVLDKKIKKCYIVFILTNVRRTPIGILRY